MSAQQTGICPLIGSPTASIRPIWCLLQRAPTPASLFTGLARTSTPQKISSRACASSTLPLIMPMRFIDGAPYVDGALGSSGGITIAQAEEAGYEKFLFIGTKPRGYVRPEVARPAFVRRIFRRYPLLPTPL